MEKEKDAVLEEKNSENNSKDDEEDLLYTHKLDSQGNSMRWNSSFCRRPGS
jgi:hypothetical protein